MAIILDRITQAVSKAENQSSWQQRGPIGFILSVLKLLKLPLPSAVAIVLVSSLVGLLIWQQMPPRIKQLINANQFLETKESIEEKFMPGEGVIVRPGTGMSQYPIFRARIIDTGLEKLGYSIKTRKQLNVPNIHIAVSNGDLDFNISHWEKLHEGFFVKNGGKDKFQRLGTLVSNTIQGYQIDQKTAKEYNITNLQQLKDPEIAKLFDSDRDGKANLIGCIPGWSCELAIEHHLDTYGLRNTVEHVQGDYSALMADTLARYRQGKPVLFYNWTPNWVGSVLKPDQDVLWLKVPFTSLPKQMGKLTEQDTSVDGINLGFPVDNIRILVNNKFLEANPAAKRWFELVNISIEDVNKQQKLVHDGEDSLEEIYAHAQEWIEENQELFDSWVEEAREAGKVAGN
ncbi:MAG: glycine betaine/L-proline ABC transporter substrate-binding protein ProX [Symploca sp. SIO2E9]|nr:glycine betaine/L-proline ABC transporter substrate-binding protein ProX [Symploca sp. SIO2E9]